MINISNAQAATWVSWYRKSFPLHFLQLMTDRILRDARISARLALGAMRLLRFSTTAA
jgi:hypothetical protein